MSNYNKTLTIIKPDAVKAHKAGVIIKMIEEHGFDIVAIKKIHLSKELTRKFYIVHQDKPFYNSLCEYMSSAPVIPMILNKKNAVDDFRCLIGATDPAKAKAGTIRSLFATSIEANAIHGSDSDENAEIESNFFFSWIENFNT